MLKRETVSNVEQTIQTWPILSHRNLLRKYGSLSRTLSYGHERRQERIDIQEERDIQVMQLDKVREIEKRCAKEDVKKNL